jgi:hypothetical protein
MRGQLATIESIIASVIIMSTIGMAANFSMWNQGGSGVRAYNTVYDMMQALDKNSTLNGCLYSGDAGCVDGFLKTLSSIEKDSSVSIYYNGAAYSAGGGLCLYKKNFCYVLDGKGICISACG